MQKIKYISNRDLLAEIQRSKATFCYFLSPEFTIYDVVVTSIDAITPELLASTITTKAAKMSTKAAVIHSSTIDPQSIVFRLMTDGHLPPETDEKKRKKSSTGEWVTKPNFPPFKHFILVDGQPLEVGRSHWRDGLHNGIFSILHGKMTNRLAEMFMLLVDQYSHRGNFRGYCVDETTEALTQRGWLNMHQITENDIILSYDNGQLKWSKIKSIYRSDYEGNMFHLTVQGMDALVTPGHKFVTANGIKDVELLLETDRLILTGDPVSVEQEPIYSDQFVEIVGWFVTDDCENIDVSFRLSESIGEDLLRVAKDKVLSMPFILSLSSSQRELLINTMIAGDGWVRRQHGVDGLSYCQKDKAHIDAFVALCTMAGYRTSCKLKDIVSFGKETQIHIVNLFSRNNNVSRVENIDFHGGKRSGRSHPGQGKVSHPNEPTVQYRGYVWCPETEYGSFIARRNGYVYLTGNSYLDEMKSQALVHLSQVALQFDESRSDNPFAFYTQIIKHCFVRVLNLEKRQHTIRDDLLIMAGAQPSYTRQVDNDIEQGSYETRTITLSMSDVHVVGSGLKSDPEANLIKKEQKKRGRKPKPKVEI